MVELSLIDTAGGKLMEIRRILRNLTVSAKLTDWLVMISTVLLTLLAFLQASEMKRQSKAAEIQANIATQTFALAYRPNVEAETAELVQQFGTAIIFIQFKNTGTTSARDVYAEAKGVSLLKGMTTEGRQTGSIQVNGDFPPGRSSVVQLGLVQKELGDVLSGMSQLRIDGKISYKSPVPGTQPLTLTNESNCFTFIFDPASRHFSRIGC